MGKVPTLARNEMEPERAWPSNGLLSFMKKYTKQEVATHLCFSDIITPMNLLRSEWIADPTLAEAWTELLTAKSRIENMLKKELAEAAENRPFWHFC